MALSIRNKRTEELARRVAAATGEGLTEAITRALEDRLARLQPLRAGVDTAAEILAIGRRCARLPDLDRRSPEEILGYQRDGTVG